MARHEGIAANQPLFEVGRQRGGPPASANLPLVAGEFTGWKGDFKGYFLGLRANNNKPYFEAHRRQYDQEIKGPLLALLADLEPEFGPPNRVARPNRDIRFSADKSPYKLNIYADVERGGYVALDAEGLVAAGGRYMVDDGQLKRLPWRGKSSSGCRHHTRGTIRAPTCCATSG